MSNFYILSPEIQDKVAVLGKNRPRWVLAANSIITASMILVPIYPTLTPEDIAYILGNSGSKYIVVDTMEQAEKVLVDGGSHALRLTFPICKRFS